MEDYMRKALFFVLIFSFLAGGIFGQSANDFEFERNASGTITITGYKGSTKQVVIPASIGGNRVTEIGEFAFARIQLTSVTIPNSVTTIGEGAFAYNKLTSVTIPNSVTTIGEGAFADNQLTNVTIPNSVTTIGEWAFSENKLTNVTIPNSVTTIGEDAFNENPLTSITLGANVRFNLTVFENNLNDFYISQGRRAGTYTWTGRAWTVR